MGSGDTVHWATAEMYTLDLDSKKGRSILLRPVGQAIDSNLQPEFHCNCARYFSTTECLNKPPRNHTTQTRTSYCRVRFQGLIRLPKPDPDQRHLFWKVLGDFLPMVYGLIFRHSYRKHWCRNKGLQGPASVINCSKHKNECLVNTSNLV